VQPTRTRQGKLAQQQGTGAAQPCEISAIMPGMRVRQVRH